MSAEFQFVEDIVPGKVDWTLKVRVIHLWKVLNKLNNNEINNIDMLLLDEKCGKIQATVKKHLLPRFQEHLQEGCTYVIDKILVAQNDPRFKKTNHKYKLNLMGMSRIANISAEEIPKNHFDFMDFATILSQEKPDVLCDVIGQVVEKNLLRELEKEGRTMLLIDIMLEDLHQQRINCTLWGDFAERIDTYLGSIEKGAPVILILQLCRVNKYQGTMGVSTAFFGTKMILDDDSLPEINEYKARMVSHAPAMTQGVTQMPAPVGLTIAEEFMQTSRMTISDLLEANDKCFGAIFAKVIEIELDQGWLYDSCNACFKRVTQLGTKFSCNHCGTFVPASPRFKIQLQVIDQTGSTTFTLFNNIVSMYVGRSCADLISSIQQQLATSPASPNEFQSFVGKHFLFKVEVSEGNIVNGWQTFTVKKITHDAAIIQQFFRKHDMQATNEEEEAVLEHHLDELATTQPLDGLEDIPTGNGIDPDSPVLETTPLPNPTGKRPMAAIYTTEISDIDLISPPSSKASKASSSDESVNNTPPSKGTVRQAMTQLLPIQFPDLAFISPPGPQLINASAEVAAIDLNNIDFNSPPTTKIALVPVKIEKNE